MTAADRVQSSEIVQLSREFMRASERASTLLQLDDYSDALMERVEEADSPEERATLIAELDLNELLVQGKVEAYLHTIDELTALAARRKALSKRLAQKAETPEHIAQRLKELLLVHMQRTNRPKIETDHFSVRRQLNPPSAEIYDEAAIPGEFVELRTTKHILLREIIARVKASGEVVAGVTVSQREGLRFS